MKKTILFLLLLGTLAWGLPAVDLDLGLFFGTRSVKDAQIREVYGNGTAYFPCVAVNFWKGLFVGLGYEGGFDREGKIGLYQEETSLKVSGLEFFAGYRFDLGKVSPYLKLGLGNYSYEQVVSGQARVDEKKSALTLAAGARFYPLKGLFLAAEIKCVPLKVKPMDIEVDLGGMRLAAGIGYTFNL
ncbi:MAG: porin family protein [Acidobacteria bacterium]|jgi:opacity protein-like surface antigen|nr:porin family protein [Acidobacteriota bacterium]